jgi:hypothetical protein
VKNSLNSVSVRLLISVLTGTVMTTLSRLSALAAVIYLVLGPPAYSGIHDGRPTHATLIEINGEGVIVPVMFPVLVAALPVVERRHWLRIVAAIVMGGFALISFSIGLFYPPAGILMALAACVED